MARKKSNRVRKTKSAKMKKVQLAKHKSKSTTRVLKFREGGISTENTLEAHKRFLEKLEKAAKEGNIFGKKELSIGKIYFIKGKEREALMLDPEYHLTSRYLKTEGKKGHHGSRAPESHEVDAFDPETFNEKTFVLKKYREIGNTNLLGEIHGALIVKEAGVTVEEPIGYYVNVAGEVFSVFEKFDRSRSMLREKKGFYEKAITDAAQAYGKLFNKGILLQDTGTKHVFLIVNKQGQVKFDRMIDFEFAVRAKKNTHFDERIYDFKKFVIDMILDGNIKSREQLMHTVNSFMSTAYPEMIDKNARKTVRRMIIRRIRFALEDIEGEIKIFTTSVDKKRTISSTKQKFIDKLIRELSNY